MITFTVELNNNLTSRARQTVKADSVSLDPRGNIEFTRNDKTTVAVFAAGCWVGVKEKEPEKPFEFIDPSAKSTPLATTGL
jgi:hypothetical protein